MTHRLVRIGLSIPAAVVLAACTRTLPVVPHAIRCDASAELLKSRCASPTPLSPDTTFATLVDAAQKDRQALQECGMTVKALQESINRCNGAIDGFNGKIDDVNDKNRKDRN